MSSLSSDQQHLVRLLDRAAVPSHIVAQYALHSMYDLILFVFELFHHERGPRHVQVPHVSPAQLPNCVTAGFSGTDALRLISLSLEFLRYWRSVGRPRSSRVSSSRLLLDFYGRQGHELHLLPRRVDEMVALLRHQARTVNLFQSVENHLEVLTYNDGSYDLVLPAGTSQAEGRDLIQLIQNFHHVQQLFDRATSFVDHRRNECVTAQGRRVTFYMGQPHHPAGI